MSLASRLLNNPGLSVLCVEAELDEVKVVLDASNRKPEALQANVVKLQYIGKQEFPGSEPIRLWNIICEGHAYHQSTRSLDGLKELGIVRYF